MKKIQKFTAKCIFELKAGTSIPCVKLDFQVHADDNPPREGFQQVVIYRREEPGFVFGKDEGEYFEGLVPSEDDIIFNGNIEVKNTFSQYSDYNVEIGKVYCYWIGRERFGQLTSAPRSIKVRDSRIWWSFDEIIAKTEALQNNYTNVHVKQMGKTVLGKPINSIFIGNPYNRIACIGAIHAGESGPEILLTAIAEILMESPEIFENCGIAVIPVLNADMREQMVKGTPWYNRLNATGVDLNRNFDSHWEMVDYSYNLSSDDYRSPNYRGPYPNSEPETQAVINFLKQTSPRAVFSYHYMASITGDRLLTAGVAKDDISYRDKCNAISRKYSDAFREAIAENKAKDANAVFVGSGGSLTDYVYKSYGIPVFDVETSMTDLLEMKARCTNDLTTYEDLLLTIRGQKNALLCMLKEFSK